MAGFFYGWILFRSDNVDGGVLAIDTDRRADYGAHIFGAADIAAGGENHRQVGIYTAARSLRLDVIVQRLHKCQADIAESG